MDKYSTDFYEPFVGGCNIIDKIVVPDDRNRYASDLDADMISLFKALQNGWIPPFNVSKKLHNTVKTYKDSFPPYLRAYISLASAFSGIRYASYTTYKTRPYSRSNSTWRGLMRQVEQMRGIIFEHKPFEDVNPNIPAVIYCDPPYKSRGDKLYWINKKDPFNHEKFYEWCVKMANAGSWVFVSEYIEPSVDHILVWEAEVKVSSSDVNHTGGKRKTAVEKLFRIKGNTND